MTTIMHSDENTQSILAPKTVSAVTAHIVALFEADDLLRDTWVIGEVSSWKRAASGHVYFSLKDSGASINAVMWRSSALNHSWLPSTGDQIIAHGYVGIYPDRGAYQLYVNRIQPAGRGLLYAQFEELKRRLAEAGLFDPERKRIVEPTARRIAVVTSADAAALRDVLRVLTARWPVVDIDLFPTLVQGSDAPAQIVAALEAANRQAHTADAADVILLVRGGGSLEDLWAFNDERVAHAIANSSIPVVCGVGHETDFTIADFVADSRMPTPSAAAASVVPDQREVQEQLLNQQAILTRLAAHRIDEARQQAMQNVRRLRLLHPERQLDVRKQQLDERIRLLRRSMRNVHQRERERLAGQTARLRSLNPQSVLSRGYSIVQQQDGRIVVSPEQAQLGETLTVQAQHGTYQVRKLEE